LAVVASGQSLQIFPALLVFNDAEERDEDLIEAWFNGAVYETGLDWFLMEILETEKEKLVSEAQRLRFIFFSQIDWDIISQAALAHFLGKKTAF
jgi:hypothetical protein